MVNTKSINTSQKVVNFCYGVILTILTIIVVEVLIVLIVITVEIVIIEIPTEVVAVLL